MLKNLHGHGVRRQVLLRHRLADVLPALRSEKIEGCSRAATTTRIIKVSYSTTLQIPIELNIWGFRVQPLEVPRHSGLKALLLLLFLLLLNYVCRTHQNNLTESAKQQIHPINSTSTTANPDATPDAETLIDSDFLKLNHATIIQSCKSKPTLELGQPELSSELTLPRMLLPFEFATATDYRNPE